jgi:hypothetical protein
MAKSSRSSKTWGIWIPKLECWMDTVKNWTVNPKGYEVREYDPSIGRV